MLMRSLIRFSVSVEDKFKLARLNHMYKFIGQEYAG